MGEVFLTVMGRLIAAVARELLPVLLPLLASGLLLVLLSRYGFDLLLLDGSIPGGRVSVVAAREVPLLLFGVALVWASSRGGVFLASSALGWMLVFAATVEAALLLRYAWLLRRLRRDPGRVRNAVICSDAGFDLSLLGAAHPFQVTSYDARRWLRADLRRVDGVHGEAALRAFGLEDEDDAALVPHFPLAAEAEQESAGASPSLNRYLNARLDSGLWEASRNLCRFQPRAVGFAWKHFHAQVTVGGRLVTLFRTAELLHRIALANVLARAQETGIIDRLARDAFLRGGTFGEWSRTVRALARACTPAEWDEMQLGPLGPALFEERADFDDCMERLEPFWKVLPRSPRPADRTTLSLLGVLWELRNRTIGHGAVGWALTVEPRPYLAALHGCFLQAVQPLSPLDFGVYAWRDDEVVACDQGLQLFGQARTGSIFLSAAVGDDNPVRLDPYAAIDTEGRLLLLNRMTSRGPEYMMTGYAEDRAPRMAVATDLSVEAFFGVAPAAST